MDSLQHIICERRTYSHIFDSHAHTYCQMLFPLEGQLTWRQKDVKSD